MVYRFDYGEYIVVDGCKQEKKIWSGLLRGQVCLDPNCTRYVYIGRPYCHQHLSKRMKIKIQESEILGAGHGIFAHEKGKTCHDVVFKKGNIVCEYKGERISASKADERYGEDGLVAYGADDPTGKVIDAALVRHVGSIANHSTRPNAKFTIQGKKLCIQAIKNIHHGDEITIDYGKRYWEPSNYWHKTVKI